MPKLDQQPLNAIAHSTWHSTDLHSGSTSTNVAHVACRRLFAVIYGIKPGLVNLVHGDALLCRFADRRSRRLVVGRSYGQWSAAAFAEVAQRIIMFNLG